MGGKLLKMRKGLVHHPLFILTLWLAALVLLLYAPFLLGDRLYMYMDIGSDTKNLYTPLYSAIVEKLRIGDFSLWEPALGMGSSLLSFQSTIFDPFATILYAVGLIFGTPSIALALVYVHALKILCAGWACYAFLSRFKLSDMAKIIASLLYALNGFIVLWGQHYFFATAVVLLPLLLTAVEQAMDADRAAYFTLPAVVGICAIYSAYLTFMMLLFASGYVLVRFFQRDMPNRCKAAAFTAGRLAGLVLLGLGLAGAIFLPTCYRLMAGGRLDGGHQPLLTRIMRNALSLYQPGYYKTLILRLFSNNYQGVGDDFIGVGHQLLSIKDVSRSNYYEAPQLFFSVLLLACAPHYLWGISRRFKRTGARIATYAGLAALFVMVVSPLGGLAFNGFTYPFSRHTFLLMPVFALIVGLTLDQAAVEKRFYKGTGVVFGVGMLAVYAYLLRDSRPEILLIKALSAASLLACIAALYWLAQSPGRYSRGAVWLLVAALSVNLYSEHRLTLQQRAIPAKQWVTQRAAIYDGDTHRALDWLSRYDTGIYRVEKAYASGTNEGMLQGYTGFAMYNGNIIPAYSEFLEGVWPATVLDHASSVYVDEGYLPSLLGIKYLLTQGEAAHHPGWEKVHQQGGVSILQNPQALPMALLYDSAMPRAQFDALTVLEKQRVLLMHAVVQADIPDGLPAVSAAEINAQSDLLSVPWLDMQQAVYQNCQSKPGQPEGSHAIHITNPPDVAWILPVNRAVVPDGADSLTLSFDAVSEVPYPLMVDVDMGEGFAPAAARQVMLYNSPVVQVQVTLPAGAQAVRLRTQVDTAISNIQTFAMDAASQLQALEAGAQVSLSATGHGGRYEGSITAHRDGLLVLSIPYERGWEITVDGTRQPVQKANVMFLAVPVQQGSHQIAAVYKAPYVQTGWWATLAGAALYLAMNTALLIRRRRGRK